MSGSALTNIYRKQALALRAATVRDLQKVWPALSYGDLARTYPAYEAAASTIITRDRARSAGLASLYLRAHRTASGVPGEPAVQLVTDIPAEQVATSLRATSLAAIKKSTMAGKTPDLAMRDAFVQSAGAATRLTLDAGRETVRLTTLADPSTAGWVRVGTGGCDWCQQYLDGEVHYTEGYDFNAHDHCMCSAEPVYDSDAAVVPPPATPPAVQAEARAKDVVEQVQDAVEQVRDLAEQVQSATETQTVASRIDFPQEALDALMPSRGGWTTSTRAKTVEALKKTPEGRQLLKTMDSFQSGGSTAIPRLRTDIEKYLAGNLDGMPQGRRDAIENFLAAAGRSDAGERPLWRGMSIPGDIEDVAARYKAGDDLDLSLASFSTDKKLAQDFTMKGAGKKVRGATKTPVLVEWVGSGKRALPIEKISKSRVFANEKEWVGAGRYSIEGVKRVKRNGVETVVLTIRQKGVW